MNVNKKPRGSLHHVEKNHIVDYMLPVTYNPLLKGGLNSMNNYPFDAMPCTNAR